MYNPRQSTLKPSSKLEVRPRVKSHGDVWDASAFSELTDFWMFSLGSSLKRGCHYINPHYTVSCHEPTAAFFLQAFWARDAWINLLLKNLGPRAFRDNFKNLSPILKQREVSGVMFHHGQFIPPPSWALLAQAAFQPNHAQFSIRRRTITPVNLETHEGRECLAEISRAELNLYFPTLVSGATFVTPSLTLEGPSLNEAFLAKAREEETDWHRKLHRTLGKNRKLLAREADLPTRMLVFHGVLAAEGRAYRPGHWPDKNQSRVGQDHPDSAEDMVSFEELVLPPRDPE